VLEDFVDVGVVDGDFFVLRKVGAKKKERYYFEAEAGGLMHHEHVSPVNGADLGSLSGKQQELLVNECPPLIRPRLSFIFRPVISPW
jgi:hypothetical protein